MLISNKNGLVSIVLFLGVHLFRKGDGACTWPTEFRDSQFYDSSRGALTFFTTTMEGWAFEPTAGSGDVYSRWECLSASAFSSSGVIMMVTNQTFPLFSQQYYAYLCITITSVTSASYMYYINHKIETNLNHERLFIYPVNSLTDQGTICSTNLGSSGEEYQMLVRIGTEQQAKVDCPWPLLGRYGYTYTTSSGDTSCDLTTSDLGVCSDTQQFTFDYTACSTRVSYSQSDTVWCVNTVSDGDTNYVMLFNGNDNDALIDNVDFYKFTCMAISDDSSAASVAPMYCRPNQIPTDFAQTASGNNLGSKLEFGAAKETCPTCPAVEGPERGNVTVTTTGAVTSAVYLCQDNYTLWGDDTRVCQADDTWSGSKPSCNCASPPVPANGAVTVSTDGSTATYTCQLGYTLSGLATRACIDGNAWEDADPGCVKCDTLQIVTGQTSVMSTNNTMTSVSFTCAKGYTLNGTLQLTCSSSGQWNGLQPQCVICDVLTNPASGTLTSTSDGSVTTATYACSSGYTLEGDDTRTCQLDGSWTGVMPSCTCNAPSAPASGTVRSNGTVATYTCTQGYTINGPSTRNCQTDGSGWSGANPTCTLCQTLTTVTGGSYTMVTSGTVTSATYTCNVGYSLDGASSIACESSGSWNNVQPKCVQCPTLTDPSSGTVTLTSSGSKTSATYACASGYNLNGNTIRLCNSDGTWSLVAPTCTCQAPLTPANGDMTHDGSTASYSCHLGYSLAGLSSRTCGTDSSGWSGSNPSCSVCATLNYPTGGSVSMSTDGINTQADYTCNSGYTLNGAATIACRSDGTWNFAAPTCAKCPDLSDPSSGTVTISTTGGVTTATFACQTGYYISGNYLLTCQTTGSWDNTSPTCKCNFPSTPSNGAVSVSDSTGGTTATYSCLVGYSLSGLASRLCMADGSGWQGADPICVVCQTISTPTAGTYSLSTSSTNTKVTFTCNVGTTLEGNSELVCQSDGTWNNAPPTCVTCDTLIDPNSGSVTLSSSGLATTATFSCVTGYTLTSTATVTCGGDGTWDLPSPNCVCSSPPLVTNGGFNVTADFAIVSYTCNVNYVLVGSETRTCQSDGTGWSGLAPTCDRCASLAHPSGGTVTATKHGATTSAHYTCVVGYTLDGAYFRECQPGGSWSPADPPTCVYCANIGIPSSGDVKLFSDGLTSQANSTCGLGYHLVGDVTRTCLTSGVWSGTTPACECNDPTQPEHGSVVADGLTANYTCSQGYSLAGSAMRTCQSGGLGWSDSDPTCESCGPPAAQAGINHVLGANGVQTFSDVSCDVGYTLSGDVRVYCNGGVWDTLPTCTLCDVLPPPGSGDVTLSTTALVTSATYICDVGYSLQGTETRTCRDDGSWDLTAPTCSCNSPPMPQHSFMTANGSHATYICDVGYSLEGDRVRVCANDGSGWIGTDPECTPCQTISTAVGRMVSLSTDGLETTASFTCTVGYTLNGQGNITCRSDGSWDFSEPVCETCPILNVPTSGDVTMTTDTMTTKATFSCLPGYFLSGTETITCLASGLWSDNEPVCRCVAPSAPLQGSVEIVDNSFGQYANYTCNLGYVISALGTRRCMDDGTGWEATDPTCERCTSLSNPTGGSVAQSTDGQTTTANYTCVVGYSLKGSNIRVCQVDTSWQPLAPTCAYCFNPGTPASGSVDLTTDGVTSVVTYSCATGYTLKGAATRVCLTTGVWDGLTPTCECEVPATPLHGTMVSDGKTANYTCDVGYALQGHIIRTCSVAGTGWSDTDPVCKQCSPLAAPNGGSYTLNSTGTQTFALFTCEKGYTMSGISKTYCSSSGGAWETPPTCSMCHPLLTPDSGTVDLASTGYATLAKYACALGYTLAGARQRVCQVDGSWDLETPSCYCNSPTVPQHGSMTANGSHATYTCGVGYSLQGDHLRVCANDGSGWSGADPECTTCLTISIPSGGAVILDTDGVETSASFTCIQGYTLNGHVTITCRGDGTWNFSPPQCVSCPTLSSPASGNVSLTSNTLVTMATFACDADYYLSGQRTATCTSAGQWSNPSPTCKCNSPGAPLHGSMYITETSGFQVANYGCALGYSISGLTQRRCLDDASGWEDVDPSCTSCDTITTTPELTVVKSTNGSSTRASYACALNYTLSGEHVHTCTSTGVWNHQKPICVLCSTKYDPPSGSVTLSTDGLVTSASFRCVTGYSTNSTTVTLCGTDGDWDLPNPFCVCDPPKAIINGGYVLLQGEMAVNYTCDSGYELVGGGFRLCSTDGTGWNGTDPRCDYIEPTTPAPRKSQDDTVLSIPPAAFIAVVVLVLLLLVALAITAACCWLRYRKERYRVSAAIIPNGAAGSHFNTVNPDVTNSKSLLLNEESDKNTKTTFNAKSLHGRALSTPSVDKNNGAIVEKSAPEMFAVTLPEYVGTMARKIPLAAVRLPALPPRTAPDELPKSPTKSTPTKSPSKTGKTRRKRRRKDEERKPLRPPTDTSASNGSLSLPETTTSTPIEIQLCRGDTPIMLQSDNLDYIKPVYCHEVDTPLPSRPVSGVEHSRTLSAIQRMMNRTSSTESSV